MSKKNSLWLIVATALIAIAAVVTAVVVRNRPPEGPQAETVVVDLSELPDEAIEALADVLDNFASLNPLVNIRLAGGGEPVEVLFGRSIPTTEGSVSRPWRSIGWRLFSSLPTLANLEGEWRQQLILPLTHGEVKLDDFIAILERGGEQDLVPIALVENDDVSSAWSLYIERLGADFGDLALSYPNLSDALDDLAEGKIMFLFWDDRLLSLIPQQVRPQHRGFTFPGSRGGDTAFFIGRMYWITLSAEAALRDEAVAIVKYITSPGVARTLQRELAGEFFFWPGDMVDSPLPEVAGPGELIAP